MTTIELLKNLTQTTYDSVDSYRKAYEKADSTTLKQALGRRLGERTETLNRLNSALEAKGDKAVQDTSVSGQAKQLFQNIADAFSDSDEAAAEQVEANEEKIAEEFRDALKSDDLDPTTRTLIETAYREIREGERFSDMLEKQYA